MSKTLLILAMLIGVGLGGSNFALAQTPCTPDPNITSPGIYPGDTLPDITEGQPYNEVIQFAFPPDTLFLGTTITFDSFVVNTVLNLPAGLDWACDQAANNCVYYTSPPSLTRGCVSIYDVSGGPTQNPAYPGYDSIQVLGQGWVTVPFVGIQSAIDTIEIYYRVAPSVSINLASPLLTGLNTSVAPHPVTATSRIAFELTAFADVRVSVHDVFGKEVALLSEERQLFGEQALEFRGADFPAGIYFVRISLNEGAVIDTKKLINVR